MLFELKSGKKKLTEKDVLAAFVCEGAVKKIFIEGYEVLPGDLELFTGKKGEVIHVKKEGIPLILFCGLGDEGKLDSEKLRVAASSVTDYCSAKKIKSLTVSVPEIKGLNKETAAKNIVEGLSLSNYAFTKYKSKNEKVLLEKVFVLTDSREIKTFIDEHSVLLSNIYLCRDLVNSNADEINPPAFADIVKKAASEKGSSMKVTVLDRKAIEKNRMGLISAVNRSSKVEPRVVVIEYKGNPKDKNTIGLIGKGITFDSGGLNLKSGESMSTMKCDMAGAATVFAAVKSMAELKISRNVTAVIPLSENLIGGDSFKPGDVYTSHSGKTVEIGNTDAEGRLLLADAISYMKEKYKPSMIVDVATLTGACVTTFGETVAAYLSNSEKMAENIESVSKITGEKVWRLPLFSDYDDRMDSEIADLSNMSSEKNAGTIASAVFLRHFIGETDWLHLDIAGTAYYSKKRGYLPKNATGYGIRNLVEFVKNAG